MRTDYVSGIQFQSDGAVLEVTGIHGGRTQTITCLKVGNLRSRIRVNADAERVSRPRKVGIADGIDSSRVDQKRIAVDRTLRVGNVRTAIHVDALESPRKDAHGTKSVACIHSDFRDRASVLGGFLSMGCPEGRRGNNQSDCDADLSHFDAPPAQRTVSPGPICKMLMLTVHRTERPRPARPERQRHTAAASGTSGLVLEHGPAKWRALTTLC